MSLLLLFRDEIKSGSVSGVTTSTGSAFGPPVSGVRRWGPILPAALPVVVPTHLATGEVAGATTSTGHARGTAGRSGGVRGTASSAAATAVTVRGAVAYPRRVRDEHDLLLLLDA